MKEITAKIRLFLAIGGVNKDIKERGKDSFADKEEKKVLQKIMVIIVWGFFLFDQSFFSPQVERSVIIRDKYVICGLRRDSNLKTT